ncbi:hypothetical protein T06_4444 [Trichinella sp. T6]|nr:hypothetical protein T06_4444 [Trichinella sp. T6]
MSMQNVLRVIEKRAKEAQKDRERKMITESVDL